MSSDNVLLIKIDKTVLFIVIISFKLLFKGIFFKRTYVRIPENMDKMTFNLFYF